MTIEDYNISNESPTFIIAELSANHNGSLDYAIETIRAAKRAGANCIKLQTYTADTLTINSRKDDFLINETIWKGKYLYDLYKEAHTPWEWHETLMAEAKTQGLICFSSPFDKTAVDFLENLNVPAYKIASFEITDIPLIEYVASKGKPIIISTGIATLDDIYLAIATCRRMGNDNIALLKCTSSYPTPVEESNLIMIRDYKKRFDLVVGLSDHTLSNIVPVVASCFGAKIIEKHFIIDRDIGGADASFSLNEQEFTEMVKSIREAEKAIGIVDYSLTDKQIKGRDFSRSLYIVKDINMGEILTVDHLRSIRPGFGLHPKELNNWIGKPSPKDFKMGDRFLI